MVHWIYQKYACEIASITEFSKDLRNKLERLAYISNLTAVTRLESRDGTEKFLFALEDGQTIESVLIPDEDRLTLCVSSQVGCAVGCRFCLTGKIGFIRNLRAHEIVDQIIAVNRSLGPQKRITNIVLMGMGEPLANFDEVIEALRRIVTLLGISKRKITLSTSGVVPKIALLAEKGPGVNLAISLNATTDATRSEIMPINKKYPLRSLLDACRKYPLGTGRRITIEYVLISGVNDSPADAERLVRILRGLRCKINLIPLNPHPGSIFKRPADSEVARFQEILIKHRMTALVRESKGSDILAACGQLRGSA
jgi:23S rRNA (adenine2503-C2)-methyltransferase